nr:unnamed protein product [Callosobruchus chinensis]
MLKPELYELIKEHKQQFVQYKFDMLLGSYGHTVPRLPPYHLDLNPIELIWATVKHNVAQRNVTFDLEDIKKLADEEFAKITPEKRQKRCNHVIDIKSKYLEKERVIDNNSEEFIITLTDTDSDSDLDFSESSEDDEHQ